MAKEEWGTKRVCPTTGKRFYDLNADPVISPYTGEVVKFDDSKNSRTMHADNEDKAVMKDDIVANDNVLEDDVLDDDADDVDLGDDILEDDDDDDLTLDEIADVPANDDE